MPYDGSCKCEFWIIPYALMSITSSDEKHGHEFHYLHPTEKPKMIVTMADGSEYDGVSLAKHFSIFRRLIFGRLLRAV
jgi:hypothetical protein